jgi:hypothetical protein
MTKTVNVTAAANGAFTYSGDGGTTGDIEIDGADTINFVLQNTDDYSWDPGTGSGQGKSAFWVTPNPGNPKTFTWSVSGATLAVQDNDSDGTPGGASHTYTLYVVDTEDNQIPSEPQIVNKKRGGG